jgi:hypothetical protein
MRRNRRIPILWQLLLPLVLLNATFVEGQTREWEIFGGYSLQRADVRQYYRSTPIIYSFRGQYENLTGWQASATENVNRWFGGTLDVAFHYKTTQEQGTSNRERMYSIMYGPRFSYRAPWLTAFGHVLMGAAHASVNVVPVGPRASDLAFVLAPGGGVDVNAGGNVAVRVFQADYLRMNLLGTRPHNFRASAGVVFTFGKER